MHRLTSIALLSVAIAFGIAGATTAQIVERSGQVYHVAVCSRAIGAGEARCHAHVVTDNRGNLLANRFVATRFGRSATGNVTPSGYGPAALWSAYYRSATPPTTGSTVAIVDAYGYTNAASDLATYRAQYGLPACPSGSCFIKVNQRGVQGSYPAQNVGWAQETALDLDMVSAMCPRCKIILVEASSASFASLAAAEAEAIKLGAHSIGNSYGGGETGVSSGQAADYCTLSAAITASTGDSAYAGGVAFPASSNCVTAVGGTSLSVASNARGWSETAWSGAGSGCSAVFTQPSWQVPGQPGMANNTGCKNRMLADVSAVADPNTGVAVFGPISNRSSTWLVFGGTSVSAQVINGVYGANGGTVLYGSSPYSDLAGLNDVVGGSTGSCTPTYFCNAIAGYDGPTGLGTPSGLGAF